MAEPEHAPRRVSQRQPADRLLAHSLSAFHTIALMVLLLAYEHRSNGLGSALGSLGTAAGVALYLVLWATTSWTTAGALRFFPLAEAKAQSWVAFLRLAVIEGSVNGVAFLWALVLVVTFKTFLTNPHAILLGAALLSLIATLFFTSIVAGLVGAVIGLVFGLVDRCLLSVGLTVARKLAAVGRTDPGGK